MAFAARRARRVSAMAVATIGALTLAACSSDADDTTESAAAGESTAATQELTPVSVQLQWLTQAQFACYYSALDQGYYAEEGLDVTILPGATSLYYWEGKLEQEYEVQMLLKSTSAHQEALLACLKSHHPYQTPELLVLPVAHGDNDYLSWLNASLR